MKTKMLESSEIENSIKKVVKQILSKEKVEYILGYEAGPLPFTAIPLFIESEADVERLIWNETCNLNLVRYMQEQPPVEKIGIILKNCEIQTLLVLINENQIKREQVIILGVPCDYGVIDGNKIKKIIGNGDIIAGKIQAENLQINTPEKEHQMKMVEVLSDSCLCCRNKNPDEYDYLIEKSSIFKAEESKDLEKFQNSDEYQDIIDFEKMPIQDRWAYFSHELEKCTLCMACKQACPLCYCKICFIDQNKPQWFDKTEDLSEKMLFHITRALHLAGRCSGCDACTRACPEGINLHLIYKKIRKIVRDRWNVDRIKLGEKSVLGSYRYEDPQDFIMSDE